MQRTFEKAVFLSNISAKLWQYYTMTCESTNKYKLKIPNIYCVLLEIFSAYKAMKKHAEHFLTIKIVFNCLLCIVIYYLTCCKCYNGHETIFAVKIFKTTYQSCYLHLLHSPFSFLALQTSWQTVVVFLETAFTLRVFESAKFWLKMTKNANNQAA